MELKEQFEQAAKDALNLPSRPDNDTLLLLYALFKQGSVGDVTGKRPGLLDLKGRAKYDAWSAKQGTGSEEAMSQYVALVNELKG